MNNVLPMPNARKGFIFLFSLVLIFNMPSFAQKISYTDHWSEPGMKLESQSTTEVDVTFSINEFHLTDIEIKGEPMKQIQLPGNYLPNDEGAPDLPAVSRYIALPQGANASVEVTSSRTEILKNIHIAPAPRIPKVTEDGPLEYNKSKKIYTRDALYPNNPVKISEKTNIRGMDVVILGITPYQYNPVTKELIVYRDLKVAVRFHGGNGQFGDNRLRSRWFDPILSDMVMNWEIVPEMNDHHPEAGSRSPDHEYVIICPDDPAFLSWADSLKKFRTMQGIRTGIYTTSDLGGNTTSAIEGFVDDAYNNWDIPPSAVLLMGDYGTSGNTVISPIWNSYCASDNIYADVTGNDMPDVIFARMTAENETHLETMVSKVLKYERTPPTNPDFYDHPITALGWQTERWFQICSETVGGYFKHVHGKDPVRINAIYSGNPGSVWSTATNTNQVVNYFGPSGTGYIPQTPAELGGWTGGSAQDVTNAINDGAFILQHRDHGGETGWGEPDYSNNNINDLTNEDLCFVFSINCLTGKYNWYNECFTEKFHRHEYGALGLIAASEVSYSFVNDTYVWGMFDNMWPDFMPDEQTPPEPRGLLPAFGNAAGKYFLQQSNWPYNTNNKEVTYNLFHHHGDAFSTLYSEVPQNLDVTHDAVLLAGVDYFTVTATENALIALSVDGEIIGVAEGTGLPVDIPITAQFPPSMIDVVVTLTNYYRYHAEVQVIPPSGPYVIKHDFEINDEYGNDNDTIDYGESILLSLTMKNVGSELGEGIGVTVSSEDANVTMTTSSADYGNIPSDEMATVDDGFAFDVAGNVPDNHLITLNIVAEDNAGNSWNSSLSATAHAPKLEYSSVTIDDALGNDNGKIDPGETVNLIVEIGNNGSADAYAVQGLLTCTDPYITINDDTLSYGDVNTGASSEQEFSVTASATTPPGYAATFDLDLSGDMGLTGSGQFDLPIGQIPVLVIDLDGNMNSGPYIYQSIQDIGLSVEYTNAFPEDPGLYTSIFLCLGVYSNNHILNESQGESLKDFLLDGGRLYMEGGDTWYYDNATPVHPYFKISGISDGSDDLGIISGQSGTFTEDLVYNYAGDNNWIDHLGAISPAFVIFKNQSPNYANAVAHDATTYKTIGSSFEFGGLVNSQNTKIELMEEYLNFFGFSGVPEAPPCPEGPESVCQGTDDSQYTTHSTEGADLYAWSVEPPDAGIVFGTDTICTVSWSDTYSGTATVQVCAMNTSGQGPLSDALPVTLHNKPTAMVDGEATICSGDSTALVLELTGTAPWHVVMNGGMFSCDIDTSPHELWVKPVITTEYTIASVSDANNCVNTGIGNITIDVRDVPETVDVPSGPASLDNYLTDTSSYQIPATQNATGYLWELQPASAGELIPDSLNCSVVWDESYKGTVQLTVMAENECGPGQGAMLEISVENTSGIIDSEAGVGVNIYPNPNTGLCTIELQSPKEANITINVLNALGVHVYSANNVSFNGNYTDKIDLSGHPEGMYFIIIESDQGKHFEKVIIQR